LWGHLDREGGAGTGGGQGGGAARGMGEKQIEVDRRLAWRRYIDRAGLGDQVPPALIEVIEAIVAFADPLLIGEVAHATWDPRLRRWSS
jgi:hypothetical protein